MDDQQTRELIGSQQTPVPVIPPLWIQEKGIVESIPGVINEFAIALVIGEDLTSGCTSWKEKANTVQANDTWLMLFFLILTVEYVNLGSPSINVSSEAKPVLYNNTLRALARRLNSNEKPQDKDIIKYNVSYTHSINKHDLAELLKMVETVKKELEEEQNKKKKKKRKKEEGKDEEEEGEEEEEEEKEVILPPPPPPPPRVLDIDAELAKDYIFEDSMDTIRNKNVIVTDESICVPTFGKDVISKVSFTVSLVPNAKGETMGYLIRLLVHDTMWNPGTLVYKLIEDCVERDKQKNNPFFKEQWPQYNHLRGSEFPVHGMSWGRWMSCVNRMLGQKPDFDTYVMETGQCNRADSRGSFNHPFQVCALEKAIKKLQEAGGMVGDVSDYRSNREEKMYTASYPLKTVRYPSNHVFWDHDKGMGLCNQFLPFAVTDVTDSFPPEMIHYLKTPDPIQKERVRDLLPQFSGYKTGNILIHMATDADKYEDRLKKITPNGPGYRELLMHYNDIWMKKFCTVMQLEGTPEYLAIPPQLKSMIKWIQDFDGVITRESQLYDPEMDLFSNWVAKQMLQYEKFAAIVQPIIPFKLRGCFSVYQRRLDQLLFNLNLYGSHGGGKSHVTINFLSKFCIPGTFKVIDRCTNAADQTDQSVHDEIRGQHEMDEAFVSTSHGKKHVDKVNMKKSSMTSGKLTVKTLEFQNVPGFGKLRGAREVTQAQNYTEVNCSNTMPDDGAIGSRYHNVLLGVSSVPIEQMNYEIDSEEKKKVINDFRVNQFLSCMFEKAMSLLAVPCRKPFMGLFEDISIRMIDALRSWGALPDESTYRALEIMRPMARQLTVEKAMLLNFHVKGAKHFGKKYNHWQLQDAAVFAWTDEPITLLTWDLHASDWIKYDFGNVLRAMWRVATNTEWTNGEKTMYEYYQNDTESRIQFKKSRNFAYDPKNDNGRNKDIYDLNEIELHGKFSELAKAIADRTHPRLKASDVEGILLNMKDKTFRPRAGKNNRNGYIRTMYSDDLRNHKGIMVPKKVLTIHGFKDVIRSYVQEVHLVLLKNVFGERFQDYAALKGSGYSPFDVFSKLKSPVNTQDMLLVVLSFTGVKESEVNDPFNTIPNLTDEDANIILHGIRNGMIRKHGDTVFTYLKIGIRVDPDLHEYPRYYCESDIPMLGGVSEKDMELEHFKHQMISLVDIQKNKITFSPMSIELFDSSIIIEAFIDATLCSSTKAKKYLLGRVHENDQSKFQTLRLTQEIIDAKVKEYDSDIINGAVLRENGIPFIRRDFIESTSRDLLFGIGNTREEKVKNSVITVKNLDRWAAEQQHIICGRPVDEPIRDSEWIRRNYSGPVGTTNYPEDIIREKMKQSAQNWEINSASKRQKSRQISKINK